MSDENHDAQKDIDEFNRKYLRACISGNSQDYLDAVLQARVAILQITEATEFIDILPELQEAIYGE